MIVCYHCAHECKLKLNQIGRCGVNKNTNEVLECLVYGYPNALQVDPVEKKPLYHFLPNSKTFSLGTVGCNFFCDFCQNWQLSQSKDFQKDRYYLPKDLVNLAKQSGCSSISCTYNEPTIFLPYARDIALEARKEGLKNIWVSNGFYSKKTTNELPDFLDAINIDLKAFSEEFYKKLGGKLSVVCENLVELAKRDIWIEVTTLLIPDRNDSEDEIKKMANFIANELGTHIPWHISAFFPAYKATSSMPTSSQSLKKAYKIGKDAGLKYIYIGNSNIQTPTICPSCQSEFVERRGFFANLKNLNEDGVCKECGEKIEGVFHE